MGHAALRQDHRGRREVDVDDPLDEQQLRYVHQVEGSYLKRVQDILEPVVGRDNLIPVFGGGITRAEQVWERALDWMGAPDEVTEASKTAIKRLFRVLVVVIFASPRRVSS